MGRTSAAFLRSTSINLPALFLHVAWTEKTDSSSASRRLSTRGRDLLVQLPPTSSSSAPATRVVSVHSANRRASCVRRAFDSAYQDNIFRSLLAASGGSGVFSFFWGGGTGVATLSSGRGGHTTNTFVLNYRVCNCLYQIINT